MDTIPKKAAPQEAVEGLERPGGQVKRAGVNPVNCESGKRHLLFSILWPGRRCVWALILLLAAVIILSVARGAGILGSAIEIGEDEHYEVSKAMLWAKGYPLYTRVWNDQPPIYTVILGLLFRSFGPTIGVARSLALIFGLMLMSGCFMFAGRRLGLVAALTSTVCLIVSPGVLKYSVSAMLEVPAIATAIWAWWALDQWIQTRRRPWLLFSGVIFAVALQIKWTAMMIGAGLICELALAAESGAGTFKPHKIISDLIMWLGCVSGAFLIIYFTWGGGLAQAWASHFSRQTIEKSEEMRFSTDVLFEHKEIIWCAMAGWVVLWWRRDWRPLAFPLVLLATAATVHAEHRPWWDYYYIHFAVPLSWLGGYGVAALLKAHQSFNRSTLSNQLLRVGSYSLAIVLLWQIGTQGGPRLEKEISRIRSLPRASDSQIVRQMNYYAGQTKWVYAQAPIFAFHAGLVEIPELAVLVRKRFWSSQISTRQIWEYVYAYRPKQLLLNEPIPLDMENFITQEYTLVYTDQLFQLYVANSVIERSKLRTGGVENR